MIFRLWMDKDQIIILAYFVENNQFLFFFNSLQNQEQNFDLNSPQISSLSNMTGHHQQHHSVIPSASQMNVQNHHSHHLFHLQQQQFL